jgi:hypothetical protein
MRTPRTPRSLLLLPLLSTAAACSNDVSTDTLGDPTSQVVAPGGAITGTVTYQGPHPCSANGHIIGNALVLVFDRRSPPPPAGLAVTAVNLAVVEGDALFQSEPRWGGPETYCPLEHGITDTITASGSFTVGPLAGASYILQSFYDYTGDFLPNFKFRQLPEKGDVVGGAIDTAAALAAINQNPNYTPTYEPVDIGIPEPLPAGAAPGTIPIFDIPASGFVVNNVQVSVGDVLATTRPYFYAEGLSAVANQSVLTVTEAQSSASFWEPPSSACPTCSNSKTLVTGSQELSDPTNAPYYMPVLTIPQDIQTFAPPVQPLLASQAGANKFEAGGPSSTGAVFSGLPHLRLRWEGSDSRQAAAAAATPFNMQLTPFTGTASGGGFDVWQGEWLDTTGTLANDAGVGPIWTHQYIPDSVYKQSGGVPVPYFWPVVILSKLSDDPNKPAGYPNVANDPANITAQGDATHPVVIMQGITLWGGDDSPTPSGPTDNDSLFLTVAEAKLLDPTHFIDAEGNPKIFHQDHITALIRPAAICFNTLFDADNSDKRGELVTPYLVSESTDTPPQLNSPVVPPDLLDNDDPNRAQVNNLVKPPPGWTPPSWSAGQACTDPTKCGPAIPGCLPKGRYAINVVYPDGQAWTVPNEAGACTGVASGEGNTNWNITPPTCTLQPRTVIQSQGPRAVVEIVGPTNPKNCGGGGPVPATPAICLPTTGSTNN